MVTLGCISDLHAEFWKEHHFDSIGVEVQNSLAEADLILMAGDIDLGTESIRTARRLFPDKPVCLVAGNHEFYGGQHRRLIATMRGVSEGSNVAFLHRESFVGSFDGEHIRVLGATLWTDFSLHNTPEISMVAGESSLNDFRLIRYDDSGRLITPLDTVQWHTEDLEWLLSQIDEPFEGKTVVLVHHAPASFAIGPKYTGDALSPCFASHLEHCFIRDDVAAVVWGHTHHCVDRTIDNTRFVSNQTGYVKGRKNIETGSYGCLIQL